jgi:hypothetical protein
LQFKLALTLTFSPRKGNPGQRLSNTIEVGLVERRNTLFPLLGERVRVRASFFSASFEKS